MGKIIPTAFFPSVSRAKVEEKQCLETSTVDDKVAINFIEQYYLKVKVPFLDCNFLSIRSGMNEVGHC